ncbi:MAG: hypothetical protein K6F99_10770 [Lachnospiraceae bacterium]|nr:hypothetical protein [Lachnospiraceae bacterium]
MLDLDEPLSKQEKLRKYGSIVNDLSLGVLLFGVWSMIKSVALVFLRPEYVIEGYERETTSFMTFFISAWAVAIVFSVPLLIRLHIYMTSRKEVLYGKKKNSHIFLSIFMIIMDLYSIYVAFVSFDDPEFEIFDSISSVFVDLSSVMILFLLVFTLFKIRKLSSDVKEAGHE